jgi:DNA-binding LacI/PurR family transcriptional regulator
MGFVGRLLNKLGLATAGADRHPIRIFLLEDDEQRCEWFVRRFKGDQLDIAIDVAEARELLQSRTYDSIFLDHDLMPEHYGSATADDERTGYAIASFLASRPELQRAATIMVHSFNADGAMRMVEELRRAGRQAEYIPFHFLEERIRNYWPR